MTRDAVVPLARYRFDRAAEQSPGGDVASCLESPLHLQSVSNPFLRGDPRISVAVGDAGRRC